MSGSDPLWRAMALLRPRLPRLLAATALGAASLGSALALAATAAWLITRAAQMPPVLDLSVAVVAVRAFGISRGVLHYCERLVSHDEALHAAGTARVQTYRLLARGTEPVAVAIPGGELAGRVGSDVDELADVLVRAVLPIAVAAVLSVAAVGVIAVISPAAAGVLALCLLVAGVVAPWLSARAAAGAEELARAEHAERDVAAMLALAHGPELRVARRLPALIDDARERQRRWGAALDATARPAAAASAVETLAVGAAVLAAAVIGIGLADQTSAPMLAVLMLLPLSSFEATAALPDAATSLTRAGIAARRLLELTGDPHILDAPALGLGPDPVGTALAAEDLCAGFGERCSSASTRPGAGRPAGFTPPGFAGSLRIEAGDRLAITGPSGAGKTALLLTLAGLIPPLGGTVRLGGVPLHGLSDEQLRCRIGYFAEDAHLFATTVRDNLLVVRGDAGDDELCGALDRVGLADWLAGLPDGLDTVLEGGAASVSAGQRRRLLLARALCSTAPVLLLDEPTEHLDRDAAAPLLRGLLTPDGLFGADRTVVVATHHLDDDRALECTRLVITAAPQAAPDYSENSRTSRS
ncbi:MAG: thiol reductant ABC exporter subunit CydC [Mycolicibacterium insubricum]|uniref:Thiol reductant ABC exporter subunit CydC n=2 Tax=Mycolicibacterium insubricum TaxID=444597 RepID=A0A1X0DHZ7_9MYCO|nr:thiol reductant ABC exporter subunit CydC [Mycolicibacterium insubricum]ORA71480.1 thiol reductant ABC exporter subunit CydC [Mycolicibacterium insubricum]